MMVVCGAGTHEGCVLFENSADPLPILYCCSSDKVHPSQHCVTILLSCLTADCYPLLLKVIGGELQERLIPVPYSKSSTDQAVSCLPIIFLVRSLAACSLDMHCATLHLCVVNIFGIYLRLRLYM